MREGAIGYSVLRVKSGFFSVMNIPFGRRTANGKIESLSNEYIDEIYSQYLEIDSIDEAKSYAYQENGYMFHIMTDGNMPDGAKWSDVFSGDSFIITMIVDGKPMVMTAEVVVRIQNIIKVYRDKGVL